MDKRNAWLQHAPVICIKVDWINHLCMTDTVLGRLAIYSAVVMVGMAFVSPLGLIVMGSIGVGICAAGIVINIQRNKAKEQIRQLANDFFGILGTICVTHGGKTALYLWCLNNEHHLLPSDAVHGDDLLLTQAEFIDPGLHFQHLEESYPESAEFDFNQTELTHADGVIVLLDLSAEVEAVLRNPVYCVETYGDPCYPNIWSTANPMILDTIRAFAANNPAGIWAFPGEVEELFASLATMGSNDPYRYSYARKVVDKVTGESLVPMPVEVEGEVEVRHIGGNDSKTVNYSLTAITDKSVAPGYDWIADLQVAIRAAVESRIKSTAETVRPGFWSHPNNLIAQLEQLTFGPYRLTAIRLMATDRKKQAIAI